MDITHEYGMHQSLFNQKRLLTMDMIAYLFVPHRDDDISFSAEQKKETQIKN